MIEVKNLVYEYPTQRAIDNVSFTIPKGSITALVGPNGAGKTTLMKCLSALEKPFAGSITIDGIDVVEQPRECHRLLAFLPDFFGLYDELTVHQSLEYFARAHEVPEREIEARVQDTARRMDLQNKIGEKVRGLSRGMRQRLAIGQTIIQKPQYLILDEPASGLDPEARFALGEEFLKLNKEGITLIVSSHILSELDQYASDLLIMRNGKIVEHSLGSKEEEQRRVIHLSLLNRVENISEIVGSWSEVDQVLVEGNSVTFNYAGSEAGQHALLKNLIERGVPVREYYTKRQSLQEQYMENVGQ